MPGRRGPRRCRRYGRTCRARLQGGLALRHADGVDCPLGEPTTGNGAERPTGDVKEVSAARQCTPVTKVLPAEGLDGASRTGTATRRGRRQPS